MDKLLQSPAQDSNASGIRPLHQRIAGDLRSRILSGEIAPDDPFPSEHELMRQYGVSRGTVRHARAALRADGTISGSQGKRLAVNGEQLTQPLTELISFSAWTESLGKAPSARVMEFKVAQADVETATALRLKPGSEIYRLVRVRLADAQPLMVERTAFVPEVGRLLESIDLVHQSIYVELAKRGISFVSARHLLSAFAATRADARYLDILVGAPLLRVRRVANGLDGMPLEWSDDRYRGDQVNFAVDNSVIVSGVVRRLES